MSAEPYADGMVQSTKDFFTTFYSAFSSGNMQELRHHYFFGFKDQEQKYYKDSPWPDVAAVAPLCQEDRLFQMLYKEYTIRHLHGIHQAPIPVKIDAYHHFVELFKFIIEWGGEIPFQLPLEWLFEIINEFVYQFQDFWQGQHKVNKNTGTPSLSEGDKELLKENPDAWSPGQVLYYLGELQKSSAIKEAIIADRDGRRRAAAALSYSGI